MARLACVRVVLAGVLLVGVALAATPQEWKGRTIYQILTDRFAVNPDPSQPCTSLSNYCGGTYEGISKKLDYIKDLGFDAIWISPVVEQYGEGYHGYWAKDIWSVNENFGTSLSLKKFVQDCHNKGIYVMVDVVANHMGCTGCRTFQNLAPFNSTDHYHDYCVIQDFNNQGQVEYCRLADLPDLDQSNSFVRSTLKSWITWLVKEYGFDGVRIDTIPEVPKDFWSEFTAAAGVYTTGECFNGNLDYVQGYEDSVGALLNYPLFYTIRDVFAYGNSMYKLESDFYQKMSKWNQVDLNPVFVDNHDNARFLSVNGDYTKYKNALVFVLTQTLPIVYYGTEQGYAGGNDPNNRESLWPHYQQDGELYQLIKRVNTARHNHTSDLTQPFVQRYADDSFYAFSRGQVLVALTNSGTDQQRTLTYHPFTSGQRVCDIVNPSYCGVVGSGGLYVELHSGQPQVLVPVS